MKMTTTLTAAKLLALFVLSSAIVLTAIGWLGWRLLAQERALDDQRLRDQLENSAASATRELDRALTDWEERLPALASGADADLPAKSVVIVVGQAGVLKRAGVALPYYPQVPTRTEAPRRLFADGEALEFTRSDLPAAERSYRRLAMSSDVSIRAAALMRLARVLRREQRLRDAIAVYGDLMSIGPDVWVAGSPAELVARRERIALYETLNDVERARRESAALSETLWSGRYLVDRTTFDFYRDGEVPPSSQGAERLSLSSHLEALWPAIASQESGRSAIADGERSFVSVRRSTPAGSAVLLGDLTAVVPSLEGLTFPGVAMVLQDESGRTVWGRETKTTGTSAVRTARETGLPWTLRAVPTDSNAAERLIRSRRLLLIAGFILAALVVATAGFVMFRAVSHELNVARLQSEFVATVSHEFRTPLTAMRHLTEMLDEGQTPPVRVSQYYKALLKETRRLQALVESLLDFGRMEEGRRTYRMEDCNPIDLVRQVIDEFSETATRRLLWDRPPATDAQGLIHVDGEALGLAIRNLIDNALKYSPESGSVRVSVGFDHSAMTIAVSDEGPGIPVTEQREIFRKFVRGSVAADRGIKGTGIGLAIADHIVQAHGGLIKVRSELGEGSTFTIMLPLAAQGFGLQASAIQDAGWTDRDREPEARGSAGARRLEPEA